KETLDAVVKARNTALSALESAGGKIGAPGAMQARGDAEAGLLGALGKLNVVVEAYPDLKANTSMEQLMEELSSTENKVAFSRQAYNDAIMSFNIARASFPAVMFAGMFGFTEVGQLDIRFEAGGREAPKVEF
ncbi:MAG: LemA family protein, partial [Planctomycetes bacterium]|nr:LemA family protein [Planctomycetota bacterium]